MSINTHFTIQSEPLIFHTDEVLHYAEEEPVVNHDTQAASEQAVDDTKEQLFALYRSLLDQLQIESASSGWDSIDVNVMATILGTNIEISSFINGFSYVQLKGYMQEFAKKHDLQSDETTHSLALLKELYYLNLINSQLSTTLRKLDSNIDNYYLLTKQDSLAKLKAHVQTALILPQAALSEYQKLLIDLTYLKDIMALTEPVESQRLIDLLHVKIDREKANNLSHLKNTFRLLEQNVTKNKTAIVEILQLIPSLIQKKMASQQTSNQLPGSIDMTRAHNLGENPSYFTGINLVKYAITNSLNSIQSIDTPTWTFFDSYVAKKENVRVDHYYYAYSKKELLDKIIPYLKSHIEIANIWSAAQDAFKLKPLDFSEITALLLNQLSTSKYEDLTTRLHAAAKDKRTTLLTLELKKLYSDTLPEFISMLKQQ